MDIPGRWWRWEWGAHREGFAFFSLLRPLVWPEKEVRDQAADLQSGFGKFVPDAPAYKGKQHPLIALGHLTRHMRHRRVSLEST